MSNSSIEETNARIRACFEVAPETDAEIEHRWMSLLPLMSDTKPVIRKRRSPVRVLIAAVLVIALATGIAAAATGTSPIKWIIRPAPAEDPGFPDASTFDKISVFDDDSAPRMSDDDYRIIESMLMPRVGPPRQGRLTADDLPSNAQDHSRVLFKDDMGRRLSGVRLKNGELCYVAKVSTTSKSRTASCSFSLLKSGVHIGGEWRGDQHQLLMFGILRDNVREVKIRTNTGELQEATMGRNSFVWNSNSPDRTVRAIAVLIMQPDGSFDEIPLTDDRTGMTPTNRELDLDYPLLPTGG